MAECVAYDLGIYDLGHLKPAGRLPVTLPFISMITQGISTQPSSRGLSSAPLIDYGTTVHVTRGSEVVWENSVLGIVR